MHGKKIKELAKFDNNELDRPAHQRMVKSTEMHDFQLFCASVCNHKSRIHRDRFEKRGPRHRAPHVELWHFCTLSSNRSPVRSHLLCTET